MASGTIKSVVPRSDIVNNLTTNDSTKVLSAAQGKALKDNADAITYGSNIPSNSNLNDYKTPGYYRVETDAIAATITNIPYQTGGHLHVEIANQSTGTNRVFQTYRPLAINYTYKRSLTGSGWTSWTSPDERIDTLNGKVNNVYNKTFSMGANNTITITRTTQHQNYIITASSTSHDQVFIVASNGGIANLGSYGSAAWSNNDETLTVVINTYRGVTIQSDNTINYTLSTTSGTFTDGSNWKPYGKLAVTNWNNQTVANIKSGLIALNNTMEDGEMRQIKFVASAASGVIRANDHYVGFIRRYVGTHFYVDASEAYKNENLILEYANGTWIENVIPADINDKTATMGNVKKGVINGSSSVNVTITLPTFVSVGRRSSTTTSATAFIDSWGGIVNIATSNSFSIAYDNNTVTITNSLQANASYIVVY